MGPRGFLAQLEVILCLGNRRMEGGDVRELGASSWLCYKNHQEPPPTSVSRGAAGILGLNYIHPFESLLNTRDH